VAGSFSGALPLGVSEYNSKLLVFWYLQNVAPHKEIDTLKQIKKGGSTHVETFNLYREISLAIETIPREI